jgi:hypothetical protein
MPGERHFDRLRKTGRPGPNGEMPVIAGCAANEPFYWGDVVGL